MRNFNEGKQQKGHESCPCQSGEEFQLRVVICGEETAKLELGAGPSHQMRTLNMGLWAVFKLLGSL